MVFASNSAQLAQCHLKECYLSAIRTHFSQFAGNQYLLFDVVLGLVNLQNPLQQNYHLNSPKTTRRNAASMTDPKNRGNNGDFWVLWVMEKWMMILPPSCLNVTCCIEDVEASQIRSHDQMIT